MTLLIIRVRANAQRHGRAVPAGRFLSSLAMSRRKTFHNHAKRRVRERARELLLSKVLHRQRQINVTFFHLNQHKFSTALFFHRSQQTQHENAFSALKLAATTLSFTSRTFLFVCFCESIGCFLGIFFLFLNVSMID